MVPLTLGLPCHLTAARGKSTVGQKYAEAHQDRPDQEGYCQGLPQNYKCQDHGADGNKIDEQARSGRTDVRIPS